MSESARYRRIYANDWHHPAFRDLDDAARVVRLYVSAGPQTTSVGCFRLSTAVAVEDLGGTAEEFEQRLGVVCGAYNWVWNESARVIWITDWFENNPPANPNVVQAWAKLLRNVPDCDVKAQAIASINHALKDLPASFREPFRELSKGFPAGNGLGNTQGNGLGETNQGSGIREFRSGIRGTGGASRRGAVTKNKDPNPIDPRVLREASAVIRDEGRNGNDDYLIDCLKLRCRTHLNLDLSRADATQALSHERIQ